MSKLMRAGLEAITTIGITLGVVVGAFGLMFGFDKLWALSGLYYGIWAVAIIVTHLVFANLKRHIRLSIGVAISVVVMLAHLAMYFTHNIATEINVVPVILHDFGFALISLITLNVVHLVIFRRRLTTAVTGPSPVQSERVDDVPAPAEARAPQESRIPLAE